ncbi:glycosyltransferase family 32 protein [Plakobranchus ocellatus]|uniref:Glycosyltransferase family 32 protein n=1 Tax=Plakobranchus ocellatus TaxID=259542 RepID=A0AAV3YNQ8_9GAST|nr:glycosyltransferase family 32 protein [Plakobranchus ocellatus]
MMTEIPRIFHLSRLWLILMSVTLPEQLSPASSTQYAISGQKVSHMSLISGSFRNILSSKEQHQSHSRVRRSKSDTFYGVQKRLPAKNTRSKKTSGYTTQPDMFNTIFQPQFRESFDTMSRLGSKNDKVTSRFAFIDNAIRGVGNSGNVYQSKTPRFRKADSLKGRTISSFFKRKRNPVKTQRGYDRGNSRTGVPTRHKTVLPSNSVGESSAHGLRPRKENQAQKGSSGKVLTIAGAKFDAEGVNISPEETFVTPTIPSPSYDRDNTDMKELFLDTFLPYSESESHHSPTVDSGKSGIKPITNKNNYNRNNNFNGNKDHNSNDNLSKGDNLNIKVDFPQFSKQAVSNVAATFQTQALAYKDSRVFHPASSSVQYPSYPVYEDALVTTDFDTLGNLMRNVHKTEKKAQKLLQGSLR